MTESAHTGAELRVLVAEDDPVNRRHASGLLTPHGYDVVTVDTGRQAVAAARQGRFDLILMDVEMPEMNGLEAAAAIRETERATGGHVPIIAVTARGKSGDRAECLAAGMDAFLPKPIQAEELLRLIAQLVGARASAPSGQAEPTYDRDELLPRLGGDESLLAEMVEILASETPRMLAELRQAVEADDAGGVQRAAHTLKGAVGVFGARPASRAAIALEGMGRERSLAGARNTMTALEREMERLNRALATLVGDAAP